MHFFESADSKNTFPAFHCLALVAIIFMIENAEGGRGFSAVKAVKNSLRNNMGNVHLDCCLEIYFNASNRHLNGPSGNELIEAKTAAILLDNRLITKAVLHWHNTAAGQKAASDSDGEGQDEAAAGDATAQQTAKDRRGGVRPADQDEMLSSIGEASFKEALLGFDDFQFGQGAMSLETLTVSGVLTATNERRDAQRAKPDFQPVPAEACTRNATPMEAADRDPVFEHVG